MKLTLSLEDELVKKLRKIAVDRDTTLTSMVRAYLERIINEHASSSCKRREGETLERTFERYQIRICKRTWKRADLYVRS